MNLISILIFVGEGITDILAKNGPIKEDKSNEQQTPRNSENNKRYNILLLGKKCSGKTTLINSIPNYFKYLNFQNALGRNKSICLVPTKFTIERYDGMTQDIVIEDGSWRANKRQKKTKLCTEFPKVYELNGTKVEYHIIDVPGIGDNDNFESDQLNKCAILKKIKEFEVIHGVFFVLNSSNPQLKVEDKNNYNDILMELHKSATPNIMFIITNSRNTDFKPGRAMEHLETYAKELERKEINIELNDKTVFCIDNEGYCYQYAIENKLIEEIPEKECYERSWNKSKRAIITAFDVIKRLPGQNVTEESGEMSKTVTIEALMGSLIKVYALIQKDMSMEMKDAQITSIMKTGDRIQRNGIVKKLNYPCCVCLDCVKMETNEIHFDFTKICHNECILGGISPDKFPETNLKNCVAFNSAGRCKKCHCHYLRHIRISCTLSQPINDRSNFEGCTRDFAERLYDALQQNLENEQYCIWSSIIDISHYLKNKTDVNVKQLFDDKTNMEIEIEMVTNENPEVIDILKNRLKDFRDEMVMQQRNVSAENINNIINALFDLKINGNLIKMLYDANRIDFTPVLYPHNVKCDIKRNTSY